MQEHHLEAVVIEPKNPARHCLVWLHGLGADGHDFETAVPVLALPSSMAVRFIFPHAPMRPVTVNRGMVMRAWYDAYGPNQAGRVDSAGIEASVAAVEQVLVRQIEGGIPPSRIVLAGFSQGGAIALQTGLRRKEPLAGLMVLSSPLPDPQQTMALLAGPNRQTPIFITHGTREAHIPAAARDQILAQLTGMGCRIEWHTYDRGHSVCPRELNDIRAWLLRLWTAK